MPAKLLIVLTLSMLCATGCGTTYDLGPEWEPLEQIRQSKVVASGLSTGGARTIGETIYVKDLEKFLEKNPEPLLTATLLHEQVHAKRQKDMGLYKWLAAYVTDKDFAYEEEQIGWYYEVKYLRAHGKQISAEGLAKALSKYKNLRGSIVSYEDAYQWVRDVLAGRWKPDN